MTAVRHLCRLCRSHEGSRKAYSIRFCWCRLRGLNSRPSVYKTAAELNRLTKRSRFGVPEAAFEPVVRARFFNVVDLVNRLETETHNRRPGRNWPSAAGQSLPGGGQPDHELAVSSARQSRFVGGLAGPPGIPPSTEPPWTEQLRNRSLPTGAQILPTARANTPDEKLGKCWFYWRNMVSAEGLEPSTP
jgi:hypothetical protein